MRHVCDTAATRYNRLCLASGDSETGSSILPETLPEFQFLQEPVQRRAMHAEHVGGMGLISFTCLQGPADQPLFVVLQSLGQGCPDGNSFRTRPVIPPASIGDIGRSDHSIGGEDERTFQDVFHLADITRPVVPPDPSPDLFRQFLNRSAEFGAEPQQVVIHDPADILHPLPERREGERHDIETVDEI